MHNLHNRETEPALLSIDFVFEMGLKKIEEQVKTIEALDVKMAVLFGFLGTVLAALLALAFAADQEKAKNLVGWQGGMLLLLGVIFTGLAIVNAFQAFRIREYFGGPQFPHLFRWTNEDAKYTKHVFLYTILAAVEKNIKRLEEKQSSANRATWQVFLAFLSFLFVTIIASVRLVL